MKESEKNMIEIICKDGEFLIKGSFSMGIAGTFVNEEFGDEDISILDWNLEDIVDELKKENYEEYIIVNTIYRCNNLINSMMDEIKKYNFRSAKKEHTPNTGLDAEIFTRGVNTNKNSNKIINNPTKKNKTALRIIYTHSTSNTPFQN